MTSAFVYGWGSTGPLSPPGDCTPVPNEDILKETELKVCSEAESEAGHFTGTPLLDTQLCAIGASSSAFKVIFALNPQRFYGFVLGLGLWTGKSFGDAT